MMRNRILVLTLIISAGLVAGALGLAPSMAIEHGPLFGQPLYADEVQATLNLATPSVECLAIDGVGEDEQSLLYLPMITIDGPSQSEFQERPEGQRLTKAAGAPTSMADPIEIEVGQVVKGSINQSGDCAVYRFDAAEGDKLFFDVQQTSNGDLSWHLNDAATAELFDSCLACNPVLQEIRQSGTHTLTVYRGPTSSSGDFQFQLWSVPDPQHFAIAVDETVSLDLPSAGAGHIESPVAADIYTFTAVANQSIFFDVQAYTSTRAITLTNVITDETNSDPFAITWSAHSSSGVELFGDCFACGDKGPFSLSEGGIYTVSVGGNKNGAFGTYQFQLLNVSAANQFEIAIGDSVSLDNPNVGAGNIETPGSIDVYTFDARAGQTVFFDTQDITSTGGISWKLEDGLGMTLFDECMGCGDPGAISLETGGTYTITVGRAGLDSIGTYQFQLLDVAANDRFEITIGDIVAEDFPAAGAGLIESPGVLDIYTISTTAGERAFFDMQSFSSGLAIQWALTDASGATLFRDCIACGDPGTVAFESGGTYTLTVGTERSESTGSYQFQLWSVPEPDRFTIAIGDVVSQNNPGQGAGHIESPGVEDIYTFNATAGQIVTFERQAISQDLLTFWTLQDSNGTTIFRKSLGRGDQRDVELALGGTYTLTVGVSNNASVGTYQFGIVPAILGAE